MGRARSGLPYSRVLLAMKETGVTSAVSCSVSIDFRPGGPDLCPEFNTIEFDGLRGQKLLLFQEAQMRVPDDQRAKSRYIMKTEERAFRQSASLGDYKTELAGNANLLENGTVPSSTENSQRDLGFTGSPKSGGIRIENKPVSKKAAASIYCTGKFSGMNSSKFRMQDTAAAIVFRKWKA
ncbi:hypothetical protein DUI87_09772 [Hirundo rustica rustica]|uniref:Uncharacterized protein n=1 Tax=Hirundo rustica rustica TaxID=333673 RepID=A0A3M0KMR6_HIRRU|nr:hypothetical protein DUI87_09772 [Hirundo rustica rustica]